ncbi:MAG TPA: c-type cytochrome biogenesis protein CcmI [Solirubrobacterales bacterium]|nr:c-type cytochrome biogenesis protein CcmI [Solirubrobacterales bacterium]
MELVYVLILAVLVAGFVAVPLVRGDGDPGEDPYRAELEDRKLSKYRELRDLELDRAAGKVGEAEYLRQRADLRREAVAILDQIAAAE